METKKIKVGVIDDQQLFRQGLISLLKKFNSIEVMLEASDAEEMFAKLEKNMPDVILLDIEMPGMSGIEATEKLKKKYPDLKIIILTMHNEEELIVYLIQNGASGFLPKNENIDKVIQAIRSVNEDGFYTNEYVSSVLMKDIMKSTKLKEKFGDIDLLEKEIEVVKLICMQFTNKQIAEKLSLSIRTVDGYRERILKKTKAKNVAGIVMYAVRNKIIV